MKTLLSWILVLSILVYIAGSVLISFININLLPYFLAFIFFIGLASSVILIITLIIERIKDRKEEKDDLSKY